MKINTLQFGEVEFEQENVIKFSKAIIGFENLLEFLFIKKDDDLFYWLNSVNEPSIAFAIFPIKVIEEHYPVKEGYEPFGIVNFEKDPMNITINLKAPVYLDQLNKTGFQKILDLDKYSLNYKLFKA